MDRWLFNETVLRVFALLLACAIWLGVNAPPAGNATPVPTGITERFPYPVHTIAAQNEVVTGLSDTSAQVIVAGTTADLTTLPGKMANVEVVADATALGPGRHAVKLAVINAPAVNFTVQPTTVTVNLERKVTEARAIHFVIHGSAASGYIVGSPSANTSTVDISGALSTVDKVTQVIASLELSQSRDTVTQTVPLSPVDSEGKVVSGVELTPSQSVVTVPLRAPSSVANVVVQAVGDPAPGFAVSGITVTPSTVQLYGPGKLAAADTVTVPVNVAGIRQTTTVHVNVPSVPGIDRVVPSELSAKVDIQPSATRIFTSVPVHVTGTSRGVHVTVTGGQTVSVSVSGPKSVINRLTESAIIALADISKVTTGQATVPINVELPEWIHVTQLSRDVLNISVTKR